MWTRSLFSPKTDIDKGTYVTLSLISVVIILALWCLLTYGGITPKDFLAAPHEVVAAGIKRIANMSLFEHMGASPCCHPVGLYPCLHLCRADRHPDGQFPRGAGAD